MFPKLDLQIGTMRIDQEIENAIHGIAVHLHERSRKSSALSQIHQAMHETHPSAQCRYTASKRRPGITISKVNGTHAAL
jgi:uncharacterized membrane protein YccC